MATSAWFDYNGYMANKLAQVQKADSAAGWDMVKLVKAFADAGFVGDAGAEQHFLAHGQYEDVAPNAFFNATEYYRAKAAQYYGKDPKAVTDLDAASIQVAIKDSGMSAWSHYEQYGNTEKVNPSNSFDTEAYMNAKLTALNSVKDGKQYTLTEVYDAFKAVGLSALEHFMIYGGKGDGEVAQKYEAGKIPAEFAVPEAKKVNPGGGASDGDTYALTTGIDTFTGKAGNDTFIGDNVGANPTIQAADQIDGGAGVNTAKFYYAATTGIEEAVLPTMKNIQKLELNGGKLTNAASRDFSGLTGVVDVSIVAPKAMANNDAFDIKMGSDQTLSLTKVNSSDTAAENATLNLKGASTVNINAVGTTKGTLTLDVADAATALVLNAVGAASNVTVANDGAALAKLSLTGDQDVNVTADSDLTKLATVDTTAAKGKVGVDLSALAAAALATGFTYAGGAGDDTLTVDGASFTATSGYKIDLGAGHDSLMIKGGASFTLTKAIAAQFTGAEALGFDMGAHKATVDASLVPTIKEFSLTGSAANAALDITKAADGTTLEILGAAASSGTAVAYAASSVSFGAGGIGKSLNLVLTGGASADDEVDMDASTGLTVDCGNLVITSSKVAGSALTEDDTFTADANAIKITGVTGSNIVIKGDHTANIEFAGGTGIVVNGSEFTGHLKFTATTGADIITGGSGNDTIVGKGGLDILTGGAGKDMFDLSGITATTANLASVKAQMATITDFTKGEDKITLHAGSATTVTIDKAVVTNLDTKLGDLLDNTPAAVTVFQYDGNTYIVNNVTASSVGTTDQIIKLDGLLDLTGASVTSDVLTWA